MKESAKKFLKLNLCSILVLSFTFPAYGKNIEETIKKVEQTAYKKGYKKGYEDALKIVEKEKEKWIKEGEERILRRLKLYEKLVRRTFNYKLLLQKGNILPPQVALICEKGEKTEDEVSSEVCKYKIVAPARFVKPEDLSFESLIREGKVEKLVKEVNNEVSVGKIYYVRTFPIEAGLKLEKKLYDAGLKPIQRNVNGKLAVGVFPDPKAEKVLKNYKEMTLIDFMNL